MWFYLFRIFAYSFAATFKQFQKRISIFFAAPWPLAAEASRGSASATSRSDRDELHQLEGYFVRILLMFLFL